MNVHHGSPGIIRSAHGIGDFIRRFWNKLVRLFALNTTVTGNADYQRRHSRAHPLHEFVAIGIVKPGWLPTPPLLVRHGVPFRPPKLYFDCGYN